MNFKPGELFNKLKTKPTMGRKQALMKNVARKVAKTAVPAVTKGKLIGSKPGFTATRVVSKPTKIAVPVKAKATPKFKQYGDRGYKPSNGVGVGGN